MITRAQRRHWAIATVAYAPNAIAADDLLRRWLQQYPVRYFGICLVADVAIWLFCSRALGKWPSER